MISNNPYAVVALNDDWIPVIIEDHWSFVKICCSETEVWKYENIASRDYFRKNPTLRKCSWKYIAQKGFPIQIKSVTDTCTEDRHSCLEKALLALKTTFDGTHLQRNRRPSKRHDVIGWRVIPRCVGHLCVCELAPLWGFLPVLAL